MKNTRSLKGEQTLVITQTNNRLTQTRLLIFSLKQTRQFSLLNRVDEIRNVNYIPNNDDILQSRRRTSDIQKLEFQVKLPIKSGGPSIQQTFCMFDVGGQRGERRKWIQVFDGVSAVMFLIDSSSFDAIDEENGKNKLKETINLFYEVWTTRFLLNSNFVLLFNKQDILREKIERGIKLEDHFPEFRLYKFQPTDRHMNRSRSSDKLNLFRTSSSRSTRSSSTIRSQTPSVPSASGLSIADTFGGGRSGQSQDPLKDRDNQNTDKASQAQTQTAPPPTTKRKSASMYLFGSSSLRRSKSTKSPNDSKPTTPLASAKSASPQVSTAATTSPTTCTTTDLDTLVNRDEPPQELSAADSRGGSRHRQQADLDHDRDTANHLAYIKARSFIRDKFIQITRQIDQPAEQRKFSSPNLPMYRTKGATIGRSAGSHTASHIDKPKRNVCYHYTTATDTENIRDLFENLQRMVLKSTMKDLV